MISFVIARDHCVIKQLSFIDYFNEIQVYVSPIALYSPLTTIVHSTQAQSAENNKAVEE